MTWFNILSTFIKIKNYLNYFWSVFVFLIYRYTTLFPQVYSNFPPYKMKWNSLFSNILSRLYSNIVCKNIVKFFQKFEVGCTQTCTPLKSSAMWHPKGGHCSVLSPCIPFKALECYYEKKSTPWHVISHNGNMFELCWPRSKLNYDLQGAHTLILQINNLTQIFKHVT